jgi:hypothetical protein
VNRFLFAKKFTSSGKLWVAMKLRQYLEKFAWPLAILLVFFLGIVFYQNFVNRSQVLAEQLESEDVTLTTRYLEGVLYYSGKVKLPTPCHKVSQTTNIRSNPNEIRIELSMQSPKKDIICAQKITTFEFSGEKEIDENTAVLVYFEGTILKKYH